MTSLKHYFNVFFAIFLAFVVTASLNYLQKYIASFTAQQLWLNSSAWRNNDVIKYDLS